MGSYNDLTTIIVNDSFEKHTCNDEGNYNIVKGYSCDDVNYIFLLDQLCPYLLQLNYVSDVMPIVKRWNLFVKEYIYF